MKLLHDEGCTIVDTTCPWVSKVWNTVEKHKKREFTSIIHGKYKHEETVATSSFAGIYLVVLNLAEAEYVANYILNGGDKAEFLAKFANAHSEGFDPDKHLDAVGIANQTTMLKGETEQIGKLFERTMLKKYGPTELNNHFHSFNTICDATQERQDAMFNLVDAKIDLMVVIGGFNSSNTTHLQEIAIEHNIPSFHIDSAVRIDLNNQIEHKPLHGETLQKASDWLPAGKLSIGVTSGASTPDKAVEEVIEKIFAIKSAVPANVRWREKMTQSKVGFSTFETYWSWSDLPESSGEGRFEEPKLTVTERGVRSLIPNSQPIPVRSPQTPNSFHTFPFSLFPYSPRWLSVAEAIANINLFSRKIAVWYSRTDNKVRRKQWLKKWAPMKRLF